MASFEFTPNGLRELSDTSVVGDPSAIIPAGEALRSLATPPTPLKGKAVGANPSLTQKSQNPKITPKTVIRAAKARVREIQQELRTHQALKTELFQLQQLLSAAKAMPKTAPKTH